MPALCPNWVQKPCDFSEQSIDASAAQFHAAGGYISDIVIILADNQAIFRAGAARVLALEDDIRTHRSVRRSRRSLVASIASFRRSPIAQSCFHPRLGLKQDMLASILAADAPAPEAGPF